MSGTGNGRRLPLPERELGPSEQHLGDRLAALIDGELGHDARERVLSHLATCCGCKREADAQRRVKNVFADTAPPPPSDGLLARLQGLPAGGPDGPDDPPASGGERRERPSGSAPAGSVWDFDYLRGGRGGDALSPNRGFRTHEVDRHSSRSRRFAFVAAGAVSLAALALGGGAGPGSTAGGGPAFAKGDSQGASASSVRTASSAAGSERDRRRRDADGARSERGSGALSVSTAGGTSGAPVPTDRDTFFSRGAPWAAPSAPPAEQESEAVHPLLRDAFFASLPARPGLPSVAHDSYNSYGTEVNAGAVPMDIAPGRKPVESEPAPSPVITAARPQG